MSHAVKAVTTERGLDAGRFTMVVYGGAGGQDADPYGAAVRRDLLMAGFTRFFLVAEVIFIVDL